MKKIALIGFRELIAVEIERELIRRCSGAISFCGISVEAGSVEHRDGYHSLEKFRNGDLFQDKIIDLYKYSEVSTNVELYRHEISGMFIRQGGSRNAYNYMEINYLYQRLVVASFNYIIKMRPDIMVFRTIPHFPADYLLFQVAKLLGIRVITIESVEPFGAAYFISDIHKKLPICPVSSHLKNFQNKSEKLISDAKEYNSFAPKYFIKTTSERKWNASLVGITYWTVIEFLKAVVGFVLNKKAYRAFKSIGRPGTHRISYFTVFIEKFQARVDLINLRRVYSALSNKTIPEKYFLFVANYQPERTTLPDAGVHWDTRVVVHDLSQSLPLGVSLVFREHPTIFSFPGATHYRGNLYRDGQFYRDIARLERVTLSPLNMDLPSLLRNCMGVITLTGSLAYQANISGKPALTFGVRWFNHCESIAKVDSLLDISKFMGSEKKLDQNDNIDAWKLFLSKLKNVLFEYPDLMNLENFHVTADCYLENLSLMIDSNESLRYAF